MHDANPTPSPGTPTGAIARSSWLWWLLAVVVLIAVLLQYLNPHFLVSMADQLWGCF